MGKVKMFYVGKIILLPALEKRPASFKSGKSTFTDRQEFRKMRRGKLMVVALSMLVLSCSPTLEKQVQYAIDEEDYVKQEQILRQLILENTYRHDYSIKRIECNLADHYSALGDDNRRIGELRLALENYEKSLSFRHNSIIVSKKKIVKARVEELDQLIDYIEEGGISEFQFQVGILEMAYRTSSPTNERSYLLDKLQESVISNSIILFEILSDSSSIDFDIFIKLLSFEQTNRNLSTATLNRLREFKKHYGSFHLLPSNYESRYNRIKFLHFIDSNLENMPQLESVKDTLLQKLKAYYRNNRAFNNGTIEDLYENYLSSSIIAESKKNIINRIKEYATNNTCNTVIGLKSKNLTAESVIECLNYYYPLVPNSEKYSRKIVIKVSHESLVSEIDVETYRKNVQSKYPVGKHTEANPEHIFWQSRVSYWTDEYSNAVSVVPFKTDRILGIMLENQRIERINEARRSLNNARLKLASIPPTIEKVDYKKYEFEEIGHKIYGNLEMKIEISLDGIVKKIIPIKSIVDEERKSAQGVAINDYFGNRDEVAVLPTVEILENILIQHAALEMKKELVTIGKNPRELGLQPIDPCEIEMLLKEKYGEATTIIDSLTGLIEQCLPSNGVISRELIERKPEKKVQKYNSLKQAAEHGLAATCQIVAYNEDYSCGSGTAYCISKNGYYITNHHVIGGKEYVILLKNINNKLYKKAAFVVYADKEKDLALIKTYKPFNDSATIDFHNSQVSELCDEVFYIGYPQSPIAVGVEPFVSRGIISQIIKNEEGEPTLILFDITANPGASGSAVIDQRTGILVGTLTWGFGRSITLNDVIDLIDGHAIRIKESQIVGTSVNVLLEFLKESGFY